MNFYELIILIPNITPEKVKIFPKISVKLQNKFQELENFLF